MIEFLSLETTLSRRTPRDENLENKNSLLDADDDEDGETSSETNSIPISPQTNNNNLTNGTSKSKTSKGKSRQITLPDDYNKLEIPTMKNLNTEKAIKNIFGDDEDAETLELLGDVIFEGQENDTLDIEIGIKVRSIRDIDELNEVCEHI